MEGRQALFVVHLAPRKVAGEVSKVGPTKRTSGDVFCLVANGGKADVAIACDEVFK
jgi:hypothetical protein